MKFSLHERLCSSQYLKKADEILVEYRDRRAIPDYAKKYPQYGFEKHKGYVTKAHKEALSKYGPCPIHRKSFKPVQEVMKEQISLNLDI